MKRSYIVSDLNLTSNKKSKDSFPKKLDLSNLRKEKLDFNNFSQSHNQNSNLFNAIISPANHLKENNFNVNKIPNPNSNSNNFPKNNINYINSHKNINSIFSNSKNFYKKMNSLDDRENLKHFSNSLVNPSPQNVNYSANNIDFNYNTNSKKYPPRNNDLKYSNKELKQLTKKSINKSNLSPNSQKKINYFNTDSCDMSINRKPIHYVNNHESNTEFNRTSTNNNKNSKNKFKNSNYIDEDRYQTKMGNHSTRHTSAHNMIKFDNFHACKNNNHNISNNETSMYRSKIDFPHTISCFNDFSPKNNAVNSEFAGNNDSNFSNYINHNFTSNCEVNGRNSNLRNSKNNNFRKINNLSFISERNGSIPYNRSPNSSTRINLNLNQNDKKELKKKLYLETVYYESDNNRTMVPAISSKFILKFFIFFRK